MENIPVYTIVNFNITLLCRMIQRQSPFKIRLDRIRQYDFPFGVNITYMKLFFGMIIIYMGYPISLIHHWVIAILYLLLLILLLLLLSIIYFYHLLFFIAIALFREKQR